MVDVYAAAGTFGDPKKVAQSLPVTLMEIEEVPDTPMFRKNARADRELPFARTGEMVATVKARPQEEIP
ncbi:hypothetical protein ABZW30_15765 [Kitasatospora sp. NPDC004669]|uniref:hypothetical protein n=1 Tax=Kitasatospora sp. NPDC004669 TaxID=3154555 RepID=UPI0033A7BE6A